MWEWETTGLKLRELGVIREHPLGRVQEKLREFGYAGIGLCRPSERSLRHREHKHAGLDHPQHINTLLSFDLRRRRLIGVTVPLNLRGIA